MIEHWFAELQRRNVIRIAGLYLVGAWLLVQVASTLFVGPRSSTFRASPPATGTSHS